MVEDPEHDIRTPEEITEAHFVRAARSLEAILLSYMEIQDKLGDDLKSAIRFGMVILGLIAISILVLLLTLSSQINHISAAVVEMNKNFTSITRQMDQMSADIDSMGKRVALLRGMDGQIAGMRENMVGITASMRKMRDKVGGISRYVGSVRKDVDVMSASIGRMDAEVQGMARDMQRMARPARTLNKMFPIP
jgi:uncharacterized protein YoxC